MASGSRDQSESDPSSDNTSSSSTSVASTTSDSETTTSLPIDAADGDFLQQILQELSLSLDSTATGGTDNVSKKSARRNQSDDRRRSQAGGKTEKELVDRVIAKIESKKGVEFKNDAIKTDSTGEEASQTEEETEPEDTQESGQEASEQEETEEKEEDTSVGGDEEDLIVALLKEAAHDEQAHLVRTSGPEPKVIAPPSQSRRKNDPQEKKVAIAEQPQTTTLQYSLFQNLFRCTNSNMLENVDDKVKEQEEKAEPLDVSSTVSNEIITSTVKTTKSSVTVPDQLEPISTTSKSKDPAADSNTDRDVEVKEEEASSPVDSNKTSVPVRLRKELSNEVILPPKALTTTSKAAKNCGRKHAKKQRRMLIQNHSMPLNLTKSDDNPKSSTPLRSVYSHDTGLVKTELQPSRNTLELPLPKTIDNAEDLDGDDLSEPLANDVLRMLQSAKGNTDKDSNTEAPEKGTDMTQSTLSAGESTAKTETDQQPKETEMEPKMSGDEGATRKKVVAQADASADEGGIVQPVAKLTRRLKSWTGKKTKRKSKSNLSAAQLESSHDFSRITLNKPRRRRKKSKFLRNLTKYVRSKPTLPVISEVTDPREDESEDAYSVRDKEVANLPDVEASSGSLSVTLNELEKEANHEYEAKSEEGGVCTLGGMKLAGEEVVDEESESSEKFMKDLFVEKNQPSMSLSLFGEETTISQAADLAKRDTNVEVGGTNSIREKSQQPMPLSFSGEETTISQAAAELAKQEFDAKLEDAMKATMIHVSPKSQPSMSLSFWGEETTISQAAEIAKKDAGAKELAYGILQVSNGTRSNDRVDRIGWPEDRAISLSEVSRESREGNISLKKHAQQDKAEITGNLCEKAQSLTKPESRECRAVRDEAGTELTLERQEIAFETEVENHPIFSKAEIAEEEDGFCIIIRSSGDEATEGEEEEKQHTSKGEANRLLVAPTQRVNRKSVPGRIFDFSKKRAPMAEPQKALAKKDDWVSIPCSSVATSTRRETDPKKRVQRQGRKVFEKSTSFLKSIKGGTHGKNENQQEVRDQPPMQDGQNEVDVGASPVLPPGPVQLQRWDSVQEKINASLKKVQSLAGHYGEDVNQLIRQSSSRVTADSVVSMELGKGDFLPDSASQEWRAVEERIDESLYKVERLASRLGVSHKLFSSE